MKLTPTIIKIAKAAHADDQENNTFKKVDKPFDELPHHIKLHYYCEAERILRIARRVKNETSL